ncbi:hypothetical protein Trydic_g19697 [Trypoxylus dichotomus]
MPQSERKSIRKAKIRRLSSYDTKDFAVELYPERISASKSSTLETSKKLWQECFVKIEPLTPNKLNLVKTVTSPLVEIRNEITHRKSRKSVTTKNITNGLQNKFEKENVDNASNDFMNEVNKSQKELVNEVTDENKCIFTNTMNDTFTLSSDEKSVMEKTNSTFTKEEDMFKESSPQLFSSISIQKLDDRKQLDDIQHKRLSISKRLSKAMKPFKSQKFSNDSKVAKPSRLSSVGVPRVPKISSSKAIQLYDFLINEQIDGKLENRMDENNKSISISESVPSGSSTPRVFENHVMKSLLKSTKKNSVSFADQPNISSNNCTDEKGKVTRIAYQKMPNFAMIHKKTFEKMENISEYQQRKTERAMLLLSGSKLKKPTPGVLSPMNKTIKKELVTLFNKDQDTSAKKDLSHIKFPHQKVANLSSNLIETKQKTTKLDNIIDDKRKTPVMNRINDTKMDKLVVKVPPTKVDIPTASTISNMPKIKSSSKQNIAPTRFGVKVPITNKKEAAKAVVNKTRQLPDNHSREEKRTAIKGVRSNRRFDLLMKMRLNK